MTIKIRPLLIAIGIIVLSIGSCFGLVAVLWNTYGDDLKENFLAAGKEGISFAATADNDACVAESLTRFGADSSTGSVTAAMRGSTFLTACLMKSTPVDGFCEGVPARSEITKVAAWKQARCDSLELKSMRCELVASVIQAHCTER